MVFIFYERWRTIEKRLVSCVGAKRECSDYFTISKMQIFVFTLVAVIAVSAVNAQPARDTGGPLSKTVCEPGHTKMEDCVGCRCVADGTGYDCTTLACLKLPATTCEPGKSFKHYCNTCVCPPHGLRAHASCCTLMACFGVWTEDGTLVRRGEHRP